MLLKKIYVFIMLALLLPGQYVKGQTPGFVEEYSSLFITNEIDISKRKVTKLKNGNFKINDYYADGKSAFVGEVTYVPSLTKVVTQGNSSSYFSNGSLKESQIQADKQIFKEYFNNGQLFKEYYFDANWNKVVTSVYTPAGEQLVVNGNGTSAELLTINGKSYEERGSYLKGYKTGEWKGYDANGKIFYVEKYGNKGLIKGVSYNEDGTENKYDIDKTSLTMRGGSAALLNFLKKNVEFPRQAMVSNVSGRATVHFLLLKSGEVKGFEIIDQPYEEFEREALRVFEKSLGQWEPTRLKGIAIDDYGTLPIVFRLSK